MPLIHVFDLGNVLLFVNEAIFIERIRPNCRPRIALERAFSRLYERARIDRGGDFGSLHATLVKELDLTMEIEELREAWNDIFTPNTPMLDVVRQSPRPRFLLSNTNEPHVTWIREKYPEIFPLFDACIFSNELGVRKPQAEIYRHVESLSGEPPHRHVFVDDVPEFVEGAKAVGWQAIRFVDTENYLRRLGKLTEDDDVPE